MRVARNSDHERAFGERVRRHCVRGELATGGSGGVCMPPTGRRPTAEGGAAGAH